MEKEWIGFSLIVTILLLSLTTPSSSFAYSGSHGGRISCAQCHIKAGGQYSITTSTGNVNLCLSCHTSGGQASNLPLYRVERASITAEGKIQGFSHRYDAPVNRVDISTHPQDAGISRRAMDGKVVCSTCHNGVTKDYIHDEKERDKKLCRDCHRVRKQTTKTYTGEKQNHPVSETVNCSSCHSTHVFQ